MSAPKANILLTTKDHTLKHLITKAQRLHFLQGQLDNLLPDSLKNKCWIANYNAETLTLATPDGMHASQLKLLSRDLIIAFQTNAHLQAFKHIACTICLPQMPVKKTLTRAKPSMSEQSQHALLNIAAGLSDVKLKEKLERLASYRKQPAITTK